jgi:7-carboxy-7-deazaguanine synthase
MDKIPTMRLSEVYTSVQGEGPNTGKPITFIRFGGCNLRCQGWGEGLLPDGTKVRGCDTVFAVYPQWRKTWATVTADEVAAQVPDQPLHVCVTGGEPLIQQAAGLKDLIDYRLKAYNVDLFTNGSQILPDWAMEPRTTVVMDWKMPGSEEFGSFKEENLALLQEKDAVKFVCKHREDFDTALALAPRVRRAQVWFGAVWNELDEGQLAEWVAAEAPYGKMNVQMHKFLWPPDERRR